MRNRDREKRERERERLRRDILGETDQEIGEKNRHRDRETRDQTRDREMEAPRENQTPRLR